LVVYRNSQATVTTRWSERRLAMFLSSHPG